MENGLSNTGAYCLLQDRRGFIWVGTQSGLNRFDGYSFKIYSRNPDDPYSLNDNFINCLHEGRPGELWVGTRQGLSRLDEKSERFENFVYRPGDPAGQPANHVVAIAQDDKGRLWLGTRGGINVFDPEKKQFQRITIDARNDAALRVNTLAFDKQGLLWIGLNSGLLRYNPANGQATKFRAWNGLSTPSVQTLLDEGDIIWLGTSDGVFKMDKKKETFVSYRTKTVPANSTKIATLLRDRQGRLLVGTLRGMEILDETNSVFYPFLVNETPGGWYKGNRPASIIEDRDGVYWISTFSDGLYKYDPSKKNFKHYYHVPGNTASLNENSVYGLFEDSRGRLWVGTGTDLNIKQPDSEQFVRFADRPVGMVWHIFEDNSNTIWIGANFGVIKQEPGKPPVYLRYNRRDNRYSSPGPSKIIFQDSQGTLWFGGGDGLFRHEPGSALFQPVPIAQYTADTNVVYQITEYPLGELWISTSNGLLRMNAATRKIKAYYHDPDNPASLCDNNISCVHVDKKGRIWVASYDGGLDKYNPADDSFFHYRKKNGLPDEKIWGLLEDDRGRLWLSSSHGISRFDPETERFRNYDIYDGVQSYEFNMGAFHKGKRSGRLYFGGINGFNAFFPDSLTENPKAPNVVFTAFRYHKGQLTDNNFAEVAGISSKDKIVLPYPVQTVVCEFAALNFRQTFKNRYAYRLEGIHKNWIGLDNKREVTFANLRPGTYTLMVKAANNDGVWNEKPAVLQFVIRPPWWASWLAFLLYALGLGALVLAVYKYQLRRRLEQQEALRLRELDDFKNRLFTNITHEFRTPLTVMLGFTNQLEAQINTPELRSKLMLIKRNGENLLRLINQLLDLAKLESKSSLAINYIHADLLAYLRYIAESLHSLAKAQNVDLQVESNLTELMMDYDPERIRQIFFNLLSNAIKFTPPGGSVTLRISCIEPRRVEVKVIDTGIGIPPEDLPRIFDRFFQADNLKKAKTGGTGIGLALTRELVKLLGGEIKVDSKIGNGSTFTVFLPFTPSPLRPLAPSPPRPLPPSRPRVLIIEDNPDVVEYLAACLCEYFRLDFAYNGKAGIEKALEIVPDLIISDVMMPEKDGFEVCDYLKNDERASHIPVVLLTAKADVSSRIAGLRIGADAYLAKPFHEVELLATLQNLLANRKKLQAKYAAFPEQPAARNPQADVDPEDAFLQKIRDIVEQNLSNADFEMQQLERALSMSRSQIFRKVKALTGKSPSQYIRSLRLHHGKHLLQTTNLTVSEIAFEVGFSTVSYFSDAFLEEFGQRPSAMRP